MEMPHEAMNMTPTKAPCSFARESGGVTNNSPTLSIDAGFGATQTSSVQDRPSSPASWRFAIMMLCAGSAVFLIGYDSNCVATIIPVLVEDFHATEDMVWYSSAYLMTSAASVLSLGKMYNLYPFKIIFTIMLTIFLVGSVICTVAQNSVTFIVGRAITGMASAGILSGMNILVSRICSLERRPFWQGVVGMAECVAICAGPLIGGVLAEYGGWRSCFYVTIPIAVISLILVLVLFQDIETPPDAHLPVSEKLSRCDPLGVALLVPTIVCLILALDWAGTYYDWANLHVLLPLVLAVCLAGAFVACQVWRGPKATLQLGLLRSRTTFACILYSGFMAASLYIIAYYIPLWFQTAREKSTLESGISTLPMVLGLSGSLFLSGSITSYIGYYTPALILGSCLLTVGTGLLTTLTLDTPTARWVIYQAIYGIGCGLGWQAPYIAVQTVLQSSTDAITLGIVLVVFAFTVGGIVALAVGQNIYLTRLVRRLRPIDARIIITTEQVNRLGMRGLMQLLGPSAEPRILQAYNDAVVDVLYSAVAVAGASLLCALCVEVRSVREKKDHKEGENLETGSD
ncbi:MFS general substrate transporter [Aspergillus uvarum CBS 121591]|uniref:MFS general substrate transporter n=1 Tax=Aspergillus uvarum CBS 121591 TaxID=1448315 RepID=A0A319E7Q9_9EURO|nr:MFS general substrate transporter [Aspergillus uvarum CBS 121591]PYH87112.1 MFS general substrate transporter [Aspergillus uvarum CBS 121591]